MSTDVKVLRREVITNNMDTGIVRAIELRQRRRPGGSAGFDIYATVTDQDDTLLEGGFFIRSHAVDAFNEWVKTATESAVVKAENGRRV